MPFFTRDALGVRPMGPEEHRSRVLDLFMSYMNNPNPDVETPFGGGLLKLLQLAEAERAPHPANILKAAYGSNSEDSLQQYGAGGAAAEPTRLDQLIRSGVISDEQYMKAFGLKK